MNDLSNPKPPLDLRQVFELLKLDKGFYTAEDPGLARKVASRIWVGAQQVFKRPELIIDIVKKLDLRGFYLPDQKRILIDGNQPALRHRWLEAHEIGHSLLPWHQEAMFGDTAHTLLPACHDVIETEANFAASRLLFLREVFAEHAKGHKASISAVQTLKPLFGNTYTTTFWRCIEAWGEQIPMVGLISGHPHPDKRPDGFDPTNPCRHFIQSPAFGAQFSKTPVIAVYEIVEKYCRPARGGSLGSGEGVLHDDNGEQHMFHFETFNFHYDVLTLGVYRGQRKLILPVTNVG